MIKHTWILILALPLILFAAVALNAQTRDYRQTETIIKKLLDKPKAAPAENTGSASGTASANEDLTSNKTVAEPNADAVLLKTGLSMFNSGSYTAAEKNFSKLISEYPDSPYTDTARIRLGQIYIKENEYDKAMETFAEVNEFSGEYPAALFDTGYCLNAKTDVTSAISCYQTVAYSFPDHELADDALVRAGLLFLQTGKGSEALSTFIDVVSKYKNRETVDESVFYMAKVYEQDAGLRDIERARDIYKLFLKKAAAGEKHFANSPLKERAERELARINSTYFRIKE